MILDKPTNFEPATQRTKQNLARTESGQCDAIHATVNEKGYFISAGSMSNKRDNGDVCLLSG